MEINADFSQFASVHTAQLDWVPSPMQGVYRRMLDRIGGEVARATSIVRYAQGSAFPEHTHSGGEEFIVLEGVFQDEHGDYPAGTYVRNPVGTHHVPGSEPGCTIFVKLWQFAPEDQEQFAIDLGSVELEVVEGVPDVSRAVLASRDYEEVALEQWAAEASVSLGNADGAEALVLDGEIALGGERYGRHDWLRVPPGEAVELSAGSEGARIWIKRGHLSAIRVPGRG